MQNPLISKKTSISIDENEIIITIKNINKYFKHGFILTKIDNTPIPFDFYTHTIDENIYNKLKTRLILKKVSLSILKNTTHMQNMSIISNIIIQDFNKLGYVLDDNNIVITMVNTSLDNLETYLNQFNPKSTLENLYNIIIYNNYFNSKTNLSYLIQNMENECFWNYNTIQLNLNNRYFTQRKFKFDSSTIKSDEAKVALNKMDDYINSNLAYSYSSISSFIKNKTKYLIRPSEIFTKDDIMNIFIQLNDKNKYLLFCYMLLTKNSYLVLNNAKLLEILTPIINKYINIIRYLLKFAWSLFYLNESIKKTYIKTSDPFIFDIHTASKLPLFPFNNDNLPSYNPYSTIFMNIHAPDKNILGIPMQQNNKGIATYSTFKRSFNIFTTGDEKTDLFDNVEFNDKIGISGSIITACIQEYNPLLDLFAGINYNEKLTKLFNEYYANSDIDVMIKTPDLGEYFLIVNKLYKQIVENICKFNPSNAQPSHVKLILNKKCNFFLSENFIAQNSELNDIKIEYIKENINTNQTIRRIFNDLYIKQILEPLLKTDNIQYKELFDDNIEFTVNINKNPTAEDKAVMNYKYSITSPHLLHNIEIFQVKYDDFFASVSRFHLPCVRAYYNGSNVFMTPSFITSQMTFMNIDYKYFAGTRDPIEIINKYRLRGYGTWLSENEIKQYHAYTNEMPYWSEVLSNTKGSIPKSDLFFKPRLWNEASYPDAKYIDTSNRYIENIRPEIQNNELGDLFNQLCAKYKHTINHMDMHINTMLSIPLNNVYPTLIPAYYYTKY